MRRESIDKLPVNQKTSESEKKKKNSLVLPRVGGHMVRLLEGAVEHCHHHVVKRIVALGVEGAEASDAAVGEPLGKRFGL